MAFNIKKKDIILFVSALIALGIATILFSFIDYLQLKYFGNRSMILLSPSKFSKVYGIQATYFFIIFLGVLKLFGLQTRNKFFLGSLVIFILMLINVTTSYTVFNPDDVFHRSIRHPIGKKYSYNDVKEVNVYLAINSLSSRAGKYINYDLVMKDNTVINLLSKHHNIAAYEQIEAKMINTPHFVTQEFLNSYLVGDFPEGYFSNFKVKQQSY